LVEEHKRKLEEERRRLEELHRQEEERKKEEQRRLDELKRLEEQKRIEKERQLEELKRLEEERKIEEQKRLEEKRRLEELKRLEEERQLEQRRLEELRKLEEERVREIERQEEQRRIKEEEEKRLRELKLLKQQEEQKRLQAETATVQNGEEAEKIADLPIRHSPTKAHRKLSTSDSIGDGEDDDFEALMRGLTESLDALDQLAEEGYKIYDTLTRKQRPQLQSSTSRRHSSRKKTSLPRDSGIESSSQHISRSSSEIRQISSSDDKHNFVKQKQEQLASKQPGQQHRSLQRARANSETVMALEQANRLVLVVMVMLIM